MDYKRLDSGLLVPRNELKVGGVFECTHLRRGEVIDEFEAHNLVVNEGLNHLLDVLFRGTTQVNPWYVGVFEGNYTPVATVTGATIASASTECTAYASSTRPEYNESAASSQTISNSSNRASFVFNAVKTVYGAFIGSNSTKGGTSGILFCAARFASAKNVESGDELLLTYSFTAASA